MHLVRRWRHDRAPQDEHSHHDDGKYRDALTHVLPNAGWSCKYRGDLEPGEPEHKQHEGDQDQSHSCHPFRALSNPFAQPAAKPETNLGCYESLNGDPRDRQDDRDAQQPGAQADRQLVDADAEPEVEDRQAARMCEQAQAAGLLALVVARPQQEQAGHEQESDPAVARPGSEKGAGGATDQHPGDRHAPLEAREATRDTPAAPLLDIGLGPGLSPPPPPPSFSGTGTAGSRGMLGFAQRNAADPSRSVQLVEMDAEHLAFQDRTFDSVAFNLCLCTIADPERAIREALRVARQGAPMAFLEHVRSHVLPIALLQEAASPLMLALDHAHSNPRPAQTIHP